MLRPINLREMEQGFRGRAYSTLVEHHVKRTSSEDILISINGTKSLLSADARPVVEQMVAHTVDALSSNPQYFQSDCGGVFQATVESARRELREAGVPADDETVFNVFHLITLNFAFMASVSPSSRGVMGIQKKNNLIATTGFSLGIVSVFFYFIGILPILAIVFSSIGLATFKSELQKNKWMAGVGLALGIIYTFMYVRAIGYLGG